MARSTAFQRGENRPQSQQIMGNYRWRGARRVATYAFAFACRRRSRAQYAAILYDCRRCVKAVRSEKVKIGSAGRQVRIRTRRLRAPIASRISACRELQLRVTVDHFTFTFHLVAHPLKAYAYLSLALTAGCILDFGRSYSILSPQ